MRRTLARILFAAAVFIATADTAEAGPLRRFLFGERSGTVQRTRSYSIGRGDSGCANGQCARAASSSSSSTTTTTTKTTKSSETVKPMPKTKAP